MTTATPLTRSFTQRLIAAASAGAATMLLMASLISLAGPQREVLMAKSTAAARVAGHPGAPVTLALQGAATHRSHAK